ncbi:MAG: hypothetical protein IJJ13_02985 [Lachnospiraceae bacterium]|nr:hypothetical protein [Lachnospiraceae bacterium]
MQRAEQEERPKENAPESALRQDFAKYKDGYLTKKYLVEGSAGVPVVLTNATNKKIKDAQKLQDAMTRDYLDKYLSLGKQEQK